MFRLSADQGLKDESRQCRKEEGQSETESTKSGGERRKEREMKKWEI